MKMLFMRRLMLVVLSLVFAGLVLFDGNFGRIPVQAATVGGSVGVEGTVPGTPPATGASITFPRNGQVFTDNPLTVIGICPKGLLVKLFKNNVFGGSASCTNGNFSIVTDMFSGRNDLVARVYDELDQAGPDSNTVSITFNDGSGFAGNRPILTSNYAKRGANPAETLTWPITISGGTSPYAISVDWGDSKPSDLISQATAGTFDIKHIYDASGIYTIIIKATDAKGATAFLQLVGVANGPLSQTNTKPNTTIITKTKILWEPAALFVIFILLAFWLGKRYELRTLVKKIERGDRPF
ncbi:MAG TPA: hypothetical protein VLE74_00675 [Candidatus Saccharimonadales bacterium]|nr:hypothetical protein [Candidatus Saccharimonadales bacterium]